jgi:hypothetical protein
MAIRKTSGLKPVSSPKYPDAMKGLIPPQAPQKPAQPKPSKPNKK